MMNQPWAPRLQGSHANQNPIGNASNNVNANINVNVNPNANANSPSANSANAKLPVQRQNGRPPGGGPDGSNGAGSEAISFQTRAAMFEQEKRRIIDSCFSKADEDGMQLESYITHIRVVEDGVFPSSPPPPVSSSSNKKNRVILVAVRRSGKVRVHKARENANGTFSIGKTWNLDELTAIQSYTGFQPTSQQERLEKGWAGLVGFIVSLGKPYYWQATTAKEKEFFIASLVKIFRKYTGGRLPELIGFTQHELDLLSGPRSASGTQAKNGAPPSNNDRADRTDRDDRNDQRPPTRSALRTGSSEADSPRPPVIQAPFPPSGEKVRRPSAPSSSQPRPDDQLGRSFPPTRPPLPQDRSFSATPPSRPDDTAAAQVPPPLFASQKSQRSSPAPQQPPERRVDTATPPSRLNGPTSTGQSGPTAARPGPPTSGPRTGMGVGSASGPVAAALAALEPSRRTPPSRSTENLARGQDSEVQSSVPTPPLPRAPEQALPERVRPPLAEQKPPSSAPSASSISNSTSNTASTTSTTTTTATTATTATTSTIQNTAATTTSTSNHSIINPPATSDKTPDYATPHGTAGAVPADKAALAESSRFNIPGQFSLPTPSSGSAGPEGPDKQDSYFEKPPVPASQPLIKKSTDAESKAEAVPAVPGPVQSPKEEAKTASGTKKTEEEFRPGLGPMVKKKSTKEIAAQFRKAAIAATAFQPRQGGAGARLRAMQEKQDNEPDGITSVVPAPLLRGLSNDNVTPASQVSEKDKERPGSPLADDQGDKPTIATATEPPEQQQPQQPQPQQQQEQPAEPAEQPPASEVQAPRAFQPTVEADKSASVSSSQPLDQPRSASPQRKKRQRQELEAEKYCSVLGIDPRVLDGRGLDFNELLTEFGWEGRLKPGRKLDHFDSDVRREIGRAQATGWLGHLDQQENRLHDLARAFDKTIVECDEMDGLLTLYSHELNTLQEDIEYIEAQSQGLQVSTANQKLLQTELESLLKTLTISNADLEPLQRARLDDNQGIASIEHALILLHRAMLTIDPDIRSNRKRQEAAATADRSGLGIYADTDIGQMRAVRQKKDAYREESLTFVRRFNQHIVALFKLAEQRSSEEAGRSSTNSASTALSSRLPAAIQTSRAELWTYSPMMLFIREVNSYEWQTLISSYEINIKATYLDYFRDTALSQRKNARKPSGDEQEALFTHQDNHEAEKFNSLTSTAARKLTVKRSKTTAKPSSLRHQLDHRRDGGGRPDAWEIFDLVLQDQARLVSEEQNFIVHLFHLSSSATLDFADVASKPAAQREMPNLSSPLPYDADRDMAKIVLQAVQGIFNVWPSDLQNLVDWVLRMDQLQAIGVLCALERAMATYEDTNQEYITRTLRQIHDRVTGLVHKFVDEQVRAIEDTKVKVKKRKGIIPFMRTLPLFITALENMMPHDGAQKDALEVRFILNDIYDKILKAMSESLNFIAKDGPAAAGHRPQSHLPHTGDPEDKEALNYHILLIENFNHFLEEVDSHGNVVLEEWAERARSGRAAHLTQYSDAVIQRPLGRWLDFVESTEALIKSAKDPASYTSIASKPSHSRSAAKKILAAYDSREVRKGADTLRKRIEKHFGDVVEDAAFGVTATASTTSANSTPTTAVASAAAAVAGAATTTTTTSNKSLMQRVLDESGNRYVQAWDRMKAIIDNVYEGSLEIDWHKEEVVSIFKR